MKIDYQKLIQKAFLDVVKSALSVLKNEGDLGEHAFYITFKTDVSGVQMPAHLKKEYPDEMTIVLQHQFKDLTVHDDAFDVDLSFKGTFFHFHIPFASMETFVDPSVQFALQFKPSLYKEEEETETVVPSQEPAKVISMDEIRNKKQ